MGERDDDIGALLLHLRHPGLGRLDDVAGLRLAFEVLDVPEHDLRRHEADDADLQLACRPEPSVMVFSTMV
jgi:hypothetical protein